MASFCIGLSGKNACVHIKEGYCFCTLSLIRSCCNRLQAPTPRFEKNLRVKRVNCSFRYPPVQCSKRGACDGQLITRMLRHGQHKVALTLAHEEHFSTICKVSTALVADDANSACGRGMRTIEPSSSVYASTSWLDFKASKTASVGTSHVKSCSGALEVYSSLEISWGWSGHS